MAGSHFTGPLIVEKGATVGSTMTFSGAVTAASTIKAVGAISSAAGTNSYFTPLQGAVTSNLTLTGMAVGDVIKGAFRIKFSAALLPTVSNLTSVATASTNLIKLTGKTTVSSLVLIHWVDVSAAS